MSSLQKIQGFEDIRVATSLFDINEADISAIKLYSKVAENYLKEFINDFYEWLPENAPEYKSLFSRAGLVENVKLRQVNYWRQLFDCTLDNDYLASRVRIGDIHAKISLSTGSYVAGISFSTSWWYKRISRDAGTDAKEVSRSFELMRALNKIFNLDMALIYAAYSQSISEIMEQQSKSLMDMTTPTIQLWDDVLVLPILGSLDSSRAQNMTNVMLEKIAQTAAKSIIIDITGVQTIDSSVANHIIKMTKATKLMGCECILSGIGSDVAQTLVHLCIDLDSIITTANLRSGLQVALAKAGYEITLADKNKK